MNNYKIILLEHVSLPNFNIKDMDEHNTNMLRASILRYGQTRTIQVREIGENKYEVIEGRNILKALQHLHIEQVICYNHGPIEEHKCVKIYLDCELVAGETNFLYLSTLVKKLQENYTLAQMEGIYSIKELTELLKLCDYDWAKYLEEQKRVVSMGLFGDEQPVTEETETQSIQP